MGIFVAKIGLVMESAAGILLYYNLIWMCTGDGKFKGIRGCRVLGVGLRMWIKGL